MNRTSAGLVSVIAAVMVGVGALLSSAVAWLSTLWGIPTLPRVFIVQDPIGWAIGPRVQPLSLLAMLLALVLLVAGTWFFVRLIARASAPGKAAALFFGTWGAIIIAALIAGVVRAPIMIAYFQIPGDNAQLLQSQFYQLSTAGAMWGLTWGWLTALIVALIHRGAAGAPASEAGVPAAYATGIPQPGYPQPGYPAAGAPAYGQPANPTATSSTQTTPNGSSSMP